MQLVVGTHALFQEQRRLPRSGAGGDRRAAPLRRRSAPAAGRQGRDDRRAGDDRDADPPHLAADAVGRDGGQPPDREAGRARSRSAPRCTRWPRWTDVVDAVARKLDEGAQVYWVCPLVAESEVLDLAAAEARFAVLRERFGDAWSGWRMASRTRRCARRRWRISPPGACGCWWRRRWSRSGVDVPEATRHGHRARRTLRPGAVASVARPGRARRRGQFLPAAARGRADRHGAGGG